MKIILLINSLKKNLAHHLMKAPLSEMDPKIDWGITSQDRDSDSGVIAILQSRFE